MLVIWMSLHLQLPDHCMFRAACTLGYFGFLRSAEFTVPSLTGFRALSSSRCTGYRSGLQSRPFMHLSFHQGPRDRSIPQGLRHSKWLGQVSLIRCSCIAPAYLVIRGNGPGPLFLCQSGQPLSCTLLTNWLRRIMASARISGHFCSHSFHIGAATIAGCNGIPVDLIQELG